MAPWLLPNARTPRYQKPVLQSYRLSPHLRETGRWPLRGEGQRRVGIRSSRQNLETVGPGPWISRLRSIQIRWAIRSSLLRRCPARDLGLGFNQGGPTSYHLIRSPRPHSITSSARASSVGGTSRPSALAVLRFSAAIAGDYERLAQRAEGRALGRLPNSN